MPITPPEGNCHDRTRRRIPLGHQALYEKNRYSPAIRANGLLFVSGQVGSREDGSPEPTLEGQVRRAFDNLNAILAAAGCSFNDVIDVTVFVVNPEQIFEKVWPIVVEEYWGSAPHPTLTGIGVTWLYGFDFEIKVVAKLAGVKALIQRVEGAAIHACLLASLA